MKDGTFQIDEMSNIGHALEYFHMLMEASSLHSMITHSDTEQRQCSHDSRIQHFSVTHCFHLGFHLFGF